MCVRGAKLYLHVPVPPAPPSSLIFSSSHDLIQWTAFSEGHPHYTTLCVSVCMNAIQRFPQWGWFFFLHSKKKGWGSSLLSSTWPMWSAMIPLFPPSLWFPSSPAFFLFPTYASLHPLLYSLPLYFSIWSLPYLLPWLNIFSHTLYQQAT